MRQYNLIERKGEILKGIIFSGPMVQAILAGRKTQTRRVLGSQPPKEWNKVEYVNNDKEVWFSNPENRHACWTVKIPHPVEAARYVKEKVWVNKPWIGTADISDVMYQDDIDRLETMPEPRPHFRGAQLCTPIGDGSKFWSQTMGGKNYQAMFMPKIASRCHIKITGVRVERLHDITRSYTDMIAEGCIVKQSESGDSYSMDGTEWFNFATHAYKAYFIQINGAKAWESNPWVFVYDFEVMYMSGDQNG